MGAEKVLPPKNRNVADQELLWRTLHALCYEVNRELVIDENYPVAALTGGATPTPTTYGGGVIRYAGFIHTSDKDVEGFCELPHGALLAQSITPHVHWMPATTGTGNVKWDLAYTITESGDTEPAETTITATDTADGTAGENLFSTLPSISIDQTAPGTQISFNFKRDTAVASNYAGTALVKTLGFHITLAATGSRSVTQL